MDRFDPRQFKVVKGLGVRMRDLPTSDKANPRQFRLARGIGTRMRDLPTSDKADPRRFKVVKGLGVRMRDLPAKYADGLQRQTNPAPPNTPDRKAQQHTPPNTNQA